MRRTVIAGNWKMNMTPSQTAAFIKELAPCVAGKDACDIVLCVPYVDIATAVEAAKGTNIKIGAENVHFAPKGAYTGEVSAEMLKAIGVEDGAWNVLFPYGATAWDHVGDTGTLPFKRDRTDPQGICISPSAV